MAVVYLVLHYVLVTAYIAAPIFAIIRSLRNRGNGGPALATLGTFSAGTAMGISLSVVYAIAVKGGVSVSQAILASYFATALMISNRSIVYSTIAVTSSSIRRIASSRRATSTGTPRAVAVRSTIDRASAMSPIRRPTTGAVILTADTPPPGSSCIGTARRLADRSLTCLRFDNAHLPVRRYQEGVSP